MNNEPKSRPIQDEGLKPCPFCLSNRIRFTYIRDGQSLGCQSCSAAVHAFNPDAAEKCIAKWNTRLSPPAAQPESQLWETFCDSSYYDMWAVRPVGENRWGHCFHVPSKDEATALVEILNAVPIAQPESQSALDECIAYKCRSCNMTLTENERSVWVGCDVCEGDGLIRVGDEDWIRMAGSIIDTVHLTAEDYVNEKLVEQLKRYFNLKTAPPSSQVAGGVGGEEKSK